MDIFTQWLTRILEPIIIKAVTAAVDAAFEKLKSTAEVSKPNEDLQNSWDDKPPVNV